MINLTTGQPGAGKTLFTLWHVQALAERENRPVYYSGIADLKLPWIELEDASKWFECPPGSIIVIDECQRLFRPRSYGSNVPEYVSKLETHRHAGHDLFLITQHPMLVDTNVRRLVGAHRHVVRAFGMQRCTVHEWGELKDNPDKNREGSIRHEVTYPKEVFGWYRSAEVHTVKRRIPARVWMLLASPLVLALMGWLAWEALAQFGKPPERSPEVAQGVQMTSAGGMTLSPRARPAVASREEWFAARLPRVEGLAYTAPAYDGITQAVEPPAPVACIESSSKGCLCYSQQGVRLTVPETTCRHLVANGVHLDWRPRFEAAVARPVASGEALSH